MLGGEVPDVGEFDVEQVSGFELEQAAAVDSLLLSRSLLHGGAIQAGRDGGRLQRVGVVGIHTMERGEILDARRVPEKAKLQPPEDRGQDGGGGAFFHGVPRRPCGQQVTLRQALAFTLDDIPSLALIQPAGWKS